LVFGGIKGERRNFGILLKSTNLYITIKKIQRNENRNGHDFVNIIKSSFKTRAVPMTINKKIKIAIGGIFCITFLFSAVLLIHIAIMVRNRPPLANATIQMARADFKTPLDSASAFNIQENVKSLKGVKSTYFNFKNHILIYTFDNRLNNAQNIYDHAIKISGFQSERHIVSAIEATQGCPVMNNNSFYGKLTAIVSKAIN